MSITLVRRVVYICIFPAMCIFGIIGNTLMLVTLMNGSLKESPYTYLSVLATGDVLLLFAVAGISFVRCGTCDFKPWTAYLGTLYEAYVYYPLGNMAVMAVTSVTLAMTVERFIFVRYPLRSASICSQKRARRIAGIVVALVVALNMPRFFLVNIGMQAKSPSVPRCQVLTCHVRMDGLVGCSLFTDREYTSWGICDVIAGSNGSLNNVESNVEGRNVIGDFPTILYYESANYFAPGFFAPLNAGINRQHVSNDHLTQTSGFAVRAQIQSVTNDTEFILRILSEESHIKEPLDFPTDSSGNHVWEVLNTTSHANYCNPLVNETEEEQDMNDTKWFLSTHLDSNLTNLEQTYGFVVRPDCLQKVGKVDRSMEKQNVKASLTDFSKFIGHQYFIFLSVCFILCVVAIGYFNLSILCTLQHSMKQRKKLTRNTRKIQSADEHRLTITLLLLSFLELVSSSVYIFTIPAIAKVIYKQDYISSQKYEFHTIVSNFMLLAEYSSSFLFFAFLNQRFRNEFFKIFTKCGLQKTCKNSSQVRKTSSTSTQVCKLSISGDSIGYPVPNE